MFYEEETQIEVVDDKNPDNEIMEAYNENIDYIEYEEVN